ncbi:MAG TPA: hypothetical protein VH877_22045 [Polyangia bacterium]|jgi:tetratricopeptide (TPR) repeat protein|nr:hypothetical protein [Polyangia bacterium]
MTRKSALPLLLLILLLGAATWQLHTQAQARRTAFPAEEDTYYLPRTQVLHHLALGHDELLADLMFIRTVNYFGAELLGRRRYEWLRPHLDTVIALDPHFRTAYLFGSRAAMYNGAPITNERVWESSHFLEAGLAVFPRDWEFAFTLGCNYLNELTTQDPQERARWRRIGGDWIRRAAIAGGGPPWLPNLAATILTEAGEVEAAIRYLEEAYLTTDQEASREQILLLLAAKRRTQQKHLEQARDEFVARWKRTLPYVPGDLFVLIGEPPTKRMDLPFLLRDPSAAEEAPAGQATRTPP